jgi:hypothetical protein
MRNANKLFVRLYVADDAFFLNKFHLIGFSIC